ncbi:DUF4232 domain-containing protein [Streptomyces catenulae]|uniref:DUF4232 domain-containing protein n=1 Tax=Streptomyces catenulae TaxID=66875 RepID=A0ABV2YS00_9ACTN|nr:DUF4232 domain-containing protein [Streptomyces catenulae]
MRTSRIRATVLATATAALALSLTACGGADSATKSDASGQSKPASGADAKGSSAEANGTDAEGRTKSASGGAGTSAGKGGTEAGVEECVGDELLVTAEHRFAGQQGDHLLLTAANKGDKPCLITSYPSVKINGEGTTLPLSKKEEGGHQAITVRPGGKLYSAVNLFDYGKDNRTGTGLSVALRGHNGQDKPAYSVDVKGEKPEFTYNEADVLNWNAKKPYDF